MFPMLKQVHIDRIEARIDRSGGPDACHPWTRSVGGPMGYGYAWVGNRTSVVHRVIYFLAHGPIPEGLVVRHHCDNPTCCNDAENTAVEKGGWRRCRKCSAENARAARERALART